MTRVPTARAGWLRVNVTLPGTTAVVDPSAGEVPVRTSCACAAVGLPDRRATIATTTASALRTQGVHCLLAAVDSDLDLPAIAASLSSVRRPNLVCGWMNDHVSREYHGAGGATVCMTGWSSSGLS